ncbi:hypothetical protein CR513_39636, partial [Mucuna pruriens]
MLRLRVVCKQNCGYIVFVSRVVRSHTYRLKTLVPNHTCGRVLDNKNAKAKWVAKVIVDKLKANNKLKSNEVINDIRITYATEITLSRAFKARQLARKGLILIFEEMMNRKKFGGGTLMRDLIMGAAKATYFKTWEDKMMQLKEIDQKAYEWLVVVPKRIWCKHAFSSYSRCDVLMNNLSESFNSTILLARDKPIITMRRLDKEVEKSRNWFATWARHLKFEVTHSPFFDKFVVNLNTQSCTCNFWDLVGIPCRHVIATITYKKDNPTNYIIFPINGHNKWPKTEHEEILPPQYKEGLKLRRRELDEDPNPTKLRRTHVRNRCKMCHQYEHNTRTCKQQPVDKVQTKLDVDKRHPTETSMPSQSNEQSQTSHPT